MDEDEPGGVDAAVTPPEPVDELVTEPVEDDGTGRNMRALTRTLVRLQVDPEQDATAAMLVTMAERMDSGKFTAHDAQQYRLGIEALSRATVSLPSSKVDELRARRQRRTRAAGAGAE